MSLAKVLPELTLASDLLLVPFQKIESVKWNGGGILFLKTLPVPELFGSLKKVHCHFGEKEVVQIWEESF